MGENNIKISLKMKTKVSRVRSIEKTVLESAKLKMIHSHFQKHI